MLLVEQNAAQALALADRGYVLETGEIVLAGTGAELLADERVRAAYLGEEIASVTGGRVQSRCTSCQMRLPSR